jgi:hypothetical protein
MVWDRERRDVSGLDEDDVASTPPGDFPTETLEDLCDLPPAQNRKFWH